MPSQTVDIDALLASPLTLPATVSDVRVSRGDLDIGTSCSVTVSTSGVSWGDGEVLHTGIVLHGIIDGGCVYAQLENEDELRFVVNGDDNVTTLYRALSAGAALAEDAIRAGETQAHGNDEMFARRSDGSVGPVEWDALLQDEDVVRFEDAPGDDKQNGDK